MSFLKKRSMRFSVGVFLILTIALWGSAATAFADSGGATATVTAGTLSEQGTFGQKVSATLSGKDQFVPYMLPILVTDATGSGAGWNLQISGTPFSDGVNGHAALTQQIIAPPAGFCAPGSSCTPPISSLLNYPLTITTTAQKFFSAAAGSGMGIINAQTPIQVTVPGNAFAGTYTTTLTLAAVSGP